MEYLLTSLSYAVGLGNLWRFPYLCYENGGGAFLLPYILSTIFLGLTFYLMETSLGQLTGQGPVSVWKICPLFEGLGYAMFIMVAFVVVYYTVILAWAVYFLFQSFTTSELPWASCGNTWNTIGEKITILEEYLFQ